MSLVVAVEDIGRNSALEIFLRRLDIERLLSLSEMIKTNHEFIIYKMVYEWKKEKPKLLKNKCFENECQKVGQAIGGVLVKKTKGQLSNCYVDKKIGEFNKESRKAGDIKDFSFGCLKRLETKRESQAYG